MKVGQTLFYSTVLKYKPALNKVIGPLHVLLTQYITLEPGFLRPRYSEGSYPPLTSLWLSQPFSGLSDPVLKFPEQDAHDDQPRIELQCHLHYLLLGHLLR